MKCVLKQWFPNFLARDPQNNNARDWGPPSTLEVAYNVMHSSANALLGQHRHQNNTKSNSLTAIILYLTILRENIIRICTIMG